MIAGDLVEIKLPKTEQNKIARRSVVTIGSGELKTQQLTKGQRYDRLKWKSTFQTSWKEKFLGLRQVVG
jgi:hypothetical protein